MVVLLQFCGLSDPLQLFYLEQRSRSGVVPHPGDSDRHDTPQGPAFAGFRPFQLDGLLEWAQTTARWRQWDPEMIRHTVMEVWMERADVIRQWQLRLRDEPADRLLVTGIGTSRDWEHRCEALLKG